MRLKWHVDPLYPGHEDMRPNPILVLKKENEELRGRLQRTEEMLDGYIREVERLKRRPAMLWLAKVEAAAAVLVQHTLSGPVVLGDVKRADLLAVRTEDWTALSEVLDG